LLAIHTLKWNTVQLISPGGQELEVHRHDIRSPIFFIEAFVSLVNIYATSHDIHSIFMTFGSVGTAGA
jgi:hypothetical protein